MINNKYPNISPSLNLDFTNSNTIDPRVTFSRASAATYYDGKTVAKAEENLLLQSQTFDGANWLKLNATVTADAGVAPDGTSTADKIAETAATGFHGPIQPLTGYVGQTVTFSVYLKAVERTWALVWFDADAAGAYYDLSTGALGTVSAGVTASPGVAVGNGWYRCAITRTITSGASPRVFTATGNNTVNYAGTDGSGILIWGAQLEQRSQVTAYTPTTTQPITNYIPVLQTAFPGVPRIDYDPITGECKGLLIEEQRTNLLTYSEQFDNAAWDKSAATISANTSIAPDGTLAADKLVADTTTGSHIVFGSVTPSVGVIYTLSYYAKAAEYSKAGIRIGGAGYATVPLAAVDLTNGTILSQQGFSSVAVQSVGNGWYRISGSFVATTGLVANIQPLNNSYSIVSGNFSYTGDGYSGIYIWGVQLEAGAFPTSYIKTEASQVTRAADSASMTGANFSSWWNPSSGTSFAEFSTLHAAGVDTKTKGVFGVGPRLLYLNGGNTVGMTNGVTALQQGTVSLAGVSSKAATSYSTSANAVSFNGLAAVNNTAGLGTINSATSAFIGFDGGSATVLNGCIKRLAYYPKRLTDAQLQALTT